MKDPLICGVPLSLYPDDEVAFFPWIHMIGLTDEERSIVGERICAVRDAHPEWKADIERRIWPRKKSV
jgi:hypothetical protein